MKMRNLEFLGKMPDPFRKEDGTRMTPEEWYANRVNNMNREFLWHR